MDTFKIGDTATITKSDYSQIEGIIIDIIYLDINLNLRESMTGKERIKYVTVIDENNKKHTGII